MPDPEPFVTGLWSPLSLSQRLRMAGMTGNAVTLNLDPAEAVMLADALEPVAGFGALPDPEGPDAVAI